MSDGESIIYVRVPAGIRVNLDRIKVAYNESTAKVIRKVLAHLIDLTSEEQGIILQAGQSGDLTGERSQEAKSTILARVPTQVKEELNRYHDEPTAEIARRVLQRFAEFSAGERKAFLRTGKADKASELLGLMSWAEHAFVKRSLMWAASGYRQMMEAAKAAESAELERFAAFRCCWCLSELVAISMAQESTDVHTVRLEERVLGYAAETLRKFAEAKDYNERHYGYAAVEYNLACVLAQGSQVAGRLARECTERSKEYRQKAKRYEEEALRRLKGLAEHGIGSSIVRDHAADDPDLRDLWNRDKVSRDYVLQVARQRDPEADGRGGELAKVVREFAIPEDHRL